MQAVAKAMLETRIMIRKEKKLHNYFSFIYITLIEIYINYAYSNNFKKYIR